MSEKGSKNNCLASLFALIFDFSKKMKKHAWSRQVYTFDCSSSSKPSDFPIIISSNLHVCSNHLKNQFMEIKSAGRGSKV